MAKSYYFVGRGIVVRVNIYPDGEISLSGLDGYTVTAKMFARIAWSILARSNTTCDGYVGFTPCADLLTENEYHERYGNETS
ncbi:MAG: hypothetical protein ACW99J_19215 [Candidatus Thorarchaeota archaeon]|jgi:hypothetical protein